MSVQNQTVKNVYEGNGSTTAFPYTFALNTDDGEYVGVYVTTGEDGISEPTTNFTIDTTSRVVTYPRSGAALSRGQKITLKRELPNEQNLNLENLGPYFAEDVEGALDNSVLLIQQLQEQVDRAVKVDVADDLPSASVIYDINHVREYKEEAAASATAAAASATASAASATASAASAADAAQSAADADTTARNARSAETNAAESARQAAVSAGQASTSAATATAAVSTVATDANRAAASATAAAASAAAALASENSADDAAQAAATSAGAAAASEAATSQLAQTAAAAITAAVAASVGAAADSAAAARVSENNAKNSELNALASATSAQTNATAAATSATRAADKEASVVASQLIATQAATSAEAAAVSATGAASATNTHMEAALAAATSSAASAQEATTQANRAGSYANAAQASAEDAEESTTEAKRLAKITMDKVAEAAVGYPAQSGRITYDGTAKTPTWDIFYEPLKMDVTGTTTATDAGTYTVTFTPKAGFYWWEDDTTTGKSQTWTIDRQPLTATPSQIGALTYNAQEQSPSWRDYDPAKLTMGGDTSGTEEGLYTTTFTPTANYCWEDGTTGARSVSWRIFALSVDIPTVTDKSLTYNRTAQGPTISTYNPLLIEVTGDTATNAGTYAVTMHLKSASIRWNDTTTADKVVPWVINRKPVTIPTVSDTAKVYDGTAQSPTVSVFDGNEVSLGGNVQETNAGSYTITMELTSTANYIWTDETTGVKSAAWTIARKAVTAPALTNTEKTYDGTEQSPTILPYDTDAIIVGGDTAATTAGTKTITFTLSSANYIWNDETTGVKTATWVILPMAVSIPTLTNTTFTYDGTEHAPTITYDQDWVTVGGTTAATNAGTQTVTFTLNNQSLKWSDETTGQKTGTWSIAKAAGSVTLSKSTISLNTSQLTDTFTVTRTGDGAISVTSSDDTIATATISGTTVTVTAVATGNVTVTVSVAEGTNWLATTDATCAVAVQLIPTVLNDATWAQISEVAQAGTGENYWDIGDVKMVPLNGKIGDNFTASNLSLGVFILDFNHVDNNVAENNIIFGGFKSALSGGKDVALIPGKYSPDDDWNCYTDGTKYFNMNHWSNLNYGGWKGSDLRYDILGATSTAPSGYGAEKQTSCVGYNATAATLTSPKADTFLAALPSDLRSKIRLHKHYVDNKGNASNVDANVTAVTDAVFLLAEFEVFGSITHANQYENNHQAQMKYYANGNAKVKYKHNSISTAVYWWGCSPSRVGMEGFVRVNDNGSITGSRAYVALGLAPAFKI